MNFNMQIHDFSISKQWDMFCSYGSVCSFKIVRENNFYALRLLKKKSTMNTLDSLHSTMDARWSETAKMLKFYKPALIFLRNYY